MNPAVVLKNNCRVRRLLRRHLLGGKTIVRLYVTLRSSAKRKYGDKHFRIPKESQP